MAGKAPLMSRRLPTSLALSLPSMLPSSFIHTSRVTTAECALAFTSPWLAER
jgi:hypothetical protein